jgi:hypothetical protein
MGAGDYVRTNVDPAPYWLYSGTAEAAELAMSVLDSRTNEQFGAFTSAYGHLAWPYRHDGGDCSAIADIRARIDDLQRLARMLEAGDFSEVNPPPSGLVYSPFAIGFSYWLRPTEGRPGFSPTLFTDSLYVFVRHEIICLALANRPIFVCEFCRELYRPRKRRDSKFCTDPCRQDAFRARNKADRAAGG